MASVSRQHTREEGERLVRTQLEEMGYDVVASDERGISFYVAKGDTEIPLQVKTIRYGAWQFTADRLMDITISEDGVQTVHGRIPPPQPGLIHVLVKLDDGEFYVLTQKDLYDTISTRYQDWLRDHEGRRPRKPESMHCSVVPGDLADYQDHWILVREALGE